MYECKATIELPNDKVVFKYNYGDWSKFKGGIEVMKAQGFHYEDFIDQVIKQFPLTTTKKMIINMLPL